ncbi:MAG: transglycosylase SLT domain-containing protein [Deltaproteobacteria bacterium]|nr:transglycosylase SLT domain-containing protein [Deltaproteobacteria bacterium]
MSVKDVHSFSPAPPPSDIQQGDRKTLDGASFVELLRLERLRSALVPGGSLEAAASPNPVVEILIEAFAQSAVAPSAAPLGTPAPQPVTADGSPPGGEGPTRLDGIVARAAGTYGLDPALIRAVIQAESGGNVRAISPAGAQGLMQLMPETARALGVVDPFDPEQNVLAGSRFLKSLLDRYDGNLESALAAYNAGPGRVDRGGTLPRETREYVGRVKRGYREFVG